MVMVAPSSGQPSHGLAIRKGKKILVVREEEKEEKEKLGSRIRRRLSAN